MAAAGLAVRAAVVGGLDSKVCLLHLSGDRRRLPVTTVFVCEKVFTSTGGRSEALESLSLGKGTSMLAHLMSGHFHGDRSGFMDELDRLAHDHVERMFR